MEHTAPVLGDPVTDEEGLTPDDLAAFLDGKLEGYELERVQAYLADHPQARQELIKASRIATTAPVLRTARSTPRWLYPAAAIAAAAAILVSVRPHPAVTTEQTATERRPPIEETERIHLVSPPDGQRLEHGAIQFAWHPYGNATYRFHLTDNTGVTILDKTTQDTLLTVDPSVAAKATGKLYWIVDALGENGSVVSSVEREFELR